MIEGPDQTDAESPPMVASDPRSIDYRIIGSIPSLRPTPRSDVSFLALLRKPKPDHPWVVDALNGYINILNDIERDYLKAYAAAPPWDITRFGDPALHASTMRGRHELKIGTFWRMGAYAVNACILRKFLEKLPGAKSALAATDDTFAPVQRLRDSFFAHNPWAEWKEGKGITEADELEGLTATMAAFTGSDRNGHVLIKGTGLCVENVGPSESPVDTFPKLVEVCAQVFSRDFAQLGHL
jgi:hypothetical protein